MSKRVTHFRSMRLYVNAGICMPECKTTGKGPLDMDATRLRTSGSRADVTCVRCRRLSAQVDMEDAIALQRARERRALEKWILAKREEGTCK